MSDKLVAGVVMRVRECSCPPSLVVEWLCRQLEQRDIPGTLYAHTVLSLLHSHYCLHSAAHHTASAPEQGLVVVGTPPATALLEHCASLLQQHHTHQCSVCRYTHDNTHDAATDSATPAATLNQHDRWARPHYSLLICRRVLFNRSSQNVLGTSSFLYWFLIFYSRSCDRN